MLANYTNSNFDILDSTARLVKQEIIVTLWYATQKFSVILSKRCSDEEKFGCAEQNN